SHKPAIVLPGGRCASSTRLSASINAQATTRVSLLAAMPTDASLLLGRNDGAHSRPIIAFDRDLLLCEIAGQNAVAALAQPGADRDRALGLFHCSQTVHLAVGRIARALGGPADAVEGDRTLVAVGGLPGLADRHYDAAPIGVLARDRGLYQRRVGNRHRD